MTYPINSALAYILIFCAVALAFIVGRCMEWTRWNRTITERELAGYDPRTGDLVWKDGGEVVS
jgi:hypothetical protein